MSLRTNYWYINVYVLWLNTILNIFLPIFSLIILNSIILRCKSLTAGPPSSEL